MFSKKAWCKPIAFASSTGQSIKNVNTEKFSPTCSKFFNDSSSDKENDLSEKSMLYSIENILY